MGTLTDELRRAIRGDMDALDPEDYLRFSSTVPDGLGELSSLLAQCTKDKGALVAAGFRWERMEKYEGYLEMLLLLHGERIASIPESPEERAEYFSLLEQAEDDRKVLRIVAHHILQETNDPKLLQIYRKVQSGAGMIDTMTDNVAFSVLIGRHMDLACEIRPGGREVTAEYLKDVTVRAKRLMRMRGLVVSDGVPRNEDVDNQNRIITLCMQAMSYIRRFARSAFYNDLDYYNSNYTKSTRRSGGSAAPSDEPIEDMEPDIAQVI